MQYTIQSTPIDVFFPVINYDVLDPVYLSKVYPPCDSCIRFRYRTLLASQPSRAESAINRQVATPRI